MWRRVGGGCVWLVLVLFLNSCHAFPEQGRWNAVINQTHKYFGVYKTVFQGTKLYIRVKCNDLQDSNVRIDWVLRKSPCWEEYLKWDFLSNEDQQRGWDFLYGLGNKTDPEVRDYLFFHPPEMYTHRCDNTIHLTEYAENCTALRPGSKQGSGGGNQVLQKRSTEFQACQSEASGGIIAQKPVFTIPCDGVFLLIMKIQSETTGDFHAEVEVRMQGDRGYLSATDYPLLIFYGCACVVYTLYGVAWLVLSFWQWRELIRVQFWIGAVIFLGMFEMAVFYAEYQSINSTGVSVTGAVLAAEIISCAKRTLARMLVVIVSIGFGIVKPRLGSTFHRILVVGAVYFALASFESCSRILHPMNGPSNRALMAGVPLSFVDAGIFYWIFYSLMSTTRTLRLRRNLVKLNLYRHFTNTLIFSVIASVIFMVWSIRNLKTADCVSDWKELWFDEAYWHVLFGLILLVIMILWRPSNNNQRFSFSPLLDNMEDEEEEDLVVNAAFSSNMKIRQKVGASNGKVHNRNQSVEDELRWVETNIPADLTEGDLPALDSEEELVSTKFELSKMQ